MVYPSFLSINKKNSQPYIWYLLRSLGIPSTSAFYFANLVFSLEIPQKNFI